MTVARKRLAKPRSSRRHLRRRSNRRPARRPSAPSRSTPRRIVRESVRRYDKDHERHGNRKAEREHIPEAEEPPFQQQIPGDALHLEYVGVRHELAVDRPAECEPNADDQYQTAKRRGRDDQSMTFLATPEMRKPRITTHTTVASYRVKIARPSNAADPRTRRRDWPAVDPEHEVATVVRVRARSPTSIPERPEHEAVVESDGAIATVGAQGTASGGGERANDKKVRKKDDADQEGNGTRRKTSRPHHKLYARHEQGPQQIRVTLDVLADVEHESVPVDEVAAIPHRNHRIVEQRESPMSIHIADARQTKTSRQSPRQIHATFGEQPTTIRSESQTTPPHLRRSPRGRRPIDYTEKNLTAIAIRSTLAHRG